MTIQTPAPFCPSAAASLDTDLVGTAHLHQPVSFRRSCSATARMRADDFCSLGFGCRSGDMRQQGNAGDNREDGGIACQLPPVQRAVKRSKQKKCLLLSRSNGYIPLRDIASCRIGLKCKCKGVICGWYFIDKLSLKHAVRRDCRVRWISKAREYLSILLTSCILQGEHEQA